MLYVQRLIAVLIIAIPGVIATYGWTIMRDVIFTNFGSEHPFEIWKFIGGLILFAGGLAFIGGWYIRRERRKQENKRT